MKCARSESQKREAKGIPAQFPVRDDPKVAEYAYSDLQERLLDLVDQAFNKHKPLFSRHTAVGIVWIS